MTRKDYEKIAAIIAAEYAKADSASADPDAFAAIEGIANRFADGLESDNPQFDRERFLKACGFE